MHRSYSTDEVPAGQRADYWSECIASAYFPLALDFAHAETFRGRLSLSALGEVSLSHLESEPLRYRRQTRHLAQDAHESFLLTIPERADFEFSQRGRSTVCAPGGFVLERSGEPYEFVYGRPNALWVLKIPERALRLRVAAPDGLCAMRFDASSGGGALFVDFVRLTARRLPELDAEAAGQLGRQVLDLLGLALARQMPGDSDESAVQAAHRRRIEAHIRKHLGDTELSPAGIAAACGVSVRYLHRLFQPTGRSVTDWIRELRLDACREALAAGEPGLAIGALAYRWGFADQAHFCRAFKARFGMSPGEARRRSSVPEPSFG